MKWFNDLSVRDKVLVILVVLALLMAFFMPAYSAPDPNSIKVQGADTIGNPVQIQVSGQSAVNSIQTPVTNTATGANAATTATLAAVAGKTTYITGFEVTSNGATASSALSINVTGTVSATMTYAYVTGTLNQSPTPVLIVEFTTPIPSSAVNTAIAVGMPAAGAGNTLQVVVVHGFYQ